MTSKKLVDCLPADFLSEKSVEICKRLSKDSTSKFESLCKVYEMLCSQLDDLPEDVSLVQYSTYDPEKLSSMHPIGLDWQIKLCESLLFIFVYTFLYKLKQLIHSLSLVLSSGNYLSAAILSRSIIEEVCFFFFFLRRIEESSLKIIQSLNNAKRGKIDAEKWSKKNSENFYDVFSNLDRATRGSSYDWSNLHHSLDGSQLPNKLHVLESVRELAKQSKLPIEKYYDLFSEMAHPNFGSHTMVIKTRISVTDQLGQVVIGDTINLESSLWFFDMCSGGLDEIVKLSLVALERGDKQLMFYKELSMLDDRHN